MRWLVVATVLAAGGIVACGDDGPDESAEEACCACVRDNSCGGTGFTFGECVPDGYAGNVDLGIDATCVANNCSDECEDASFQ
jgi:hypothetical protein